MPDAPSRSPWSISLSQVLSDREKAFFAALTPHSMRVVDQPEPPQVLTTDRADDLLPSDQGRPPGGSLQYLWGIDITTVLVVSLAAVPVSFCKVLGAETGRLFWALVKKVLNRASSRKRGQPLQSLQIVLPPRKYHGIELDIVFVFIGCKSLTEEVWLGVSQTLSRSLEPKLLEVAGRIEKATSNGSLRSGQRVLLSAIVNGEASPVWQAKVRD